MSPIYYEYLRNAALVTRAKISEAGYNAAYVLQNPKEYYDKFLHYGVLVKDDFVTTVSNIHNDPMGFIETVGTEVGTKLFDAWTAVQEEVLYRPTLFTLGTAAIFAAKILYSRLRTVQQSFDKFPQNLNEMQREFQGLHSNQYDVRRSVIRLSSGVDMEYGSVGGTQWNYAPVAIKGSNGKVKKALLKFDTREALELALNDLNKPTNYNAETFTHAQLVEWPADGNVVKRMQLDAELSSIYGLLTGNLFKTVSKEGHISYSSPELKATLREVNKRQILEVSYQPLEAANGVQNCKDTGQLLIRDVTNLLKDGNVDTIFGGFAMLLHIVDAKTREQLLKANFTDYDWRYSAVGKSRTKDKDAKTFSLAEIFKLAKALSNPYSLSAYAADRVVVKLAKGQAPTSLKGLVEKPLNFGGHLMWPVKNGALANVEFLKLPMALEAIQAQRYSRVFEFLNLKAFAPRNGVIDLTAWKKNKTALLRSPVGITGLKGADDKKDAVYYVYNEQDAFDKQPGTKNSPESAQVSQALRAYLANGGRSDDLKALLEIMDGGKSILQLDSKGNVAKAPIAGNFDLKKMKFLVDADKIVWTTVTPEEADLILAKIKARTAPTVGRKSAPAALTA